MLLFICCGLSMVKRDHFCGRRSIGRSLESLPAKKSNLSFAIVSREEKGRSWMCKKRHKAMFDFCVSLIHHLRPKNGKEKRHHSNIPDKDSSNLCEDRLCSHFVLLTPSIISSHLFQMLWLYWHNYTATYLSCYRDYDCAGWWHTAPGICIFYKNYSWKSASEANRPWGVFSHLQCAVCDHLTRDNELVAFSQSKWNRPWLSFLTW